jgi:hypothetical protein
MSKSLMQVIMLILRMSIVVAFFKVIVLFFLSSRRRLDIRLLVTFLIFTLQLTIIVIMLLKIIAITNVFVIGFLIVVNEIITLYV